jgi:hypothetical protein
MHWVKPCTSGYSKSGSVESNVLICGDAAALVLLHRKVVSIGLDLGQQMESYVFVAGTCCGICSTSISRLMPTLAMLFLEVRPRYIPARLLS